MYENVILCGSIQHKKTQHLSTARPHTGRTGTSGTGITLQPAQMPSSGASAAASAVQSTAGSKLVTWYCYDRKQRRHGCTNRNYPDFVLRQMVAEIMDTDDFDETTFLEQVDHITADPGETITLHFRDGRTAQWQGI